jgi:hypothetical protein
MERKSLEIRNEYLALEECLNLLFPSLNSRSISIFQRAPSPETIITDNIDESAEEEAENEILPSLDTESKIRSNSPPPEISKSSLPGLQRDLRHLISNQLKRTRPPPVAITQEGSLGNDGIVLLSTPLSRRAVNVDLPVMLSVDDSEWEDGSVLGDGDAKDEDSHPKRKRLNEDQIVSFLFFSLLDLCDVIGRDNRFGYN